MDVQKIVDEVAARTRIRIDKDDPAFAMATLIDVACEQALERVKIRFDASLKYFEQGATKVQGRMAAMLVKEITAKLVVLKSKSATKSTRDAGWPERPFIALVIVFVSGLILGMVLAIKLF
jgi:hypothetical protein